MTGTTIRRHPIELLPRSERVILRPFFPSDPAHIGAILARIQGLREDEAERVLHGVLRDFGARHRDLESALLDNYDRALPHVQTEAPLSRCRRLLIGAMFSGEYSLESAALFNPSIVAHPDQSDAPDGGLRFIMSLRSVGEGHISSVEFRAGTIDADGEITLDPPTGYVGAARIVPNARYKRKKVEYAIDFPSTSPIDERAIFPVSANESNGIEDARFVRFVEHDGSALYYATYTAYNGHAISPQLIETRDFLHFRVLTLGGNAVRNKGMALFPRRVAGRYAMLSRQDNENILIMFSDDPHRWSDAEVVVRPVSYWEATKIGNCGSPVETEAGWLVITHGVGPMRTYHLGAVLLDLDDPTRVIGRLTQPLISPESVGREGYVPNVVYSCGSLLHGRSLILPYAMSDRVTTIATVALDELLAAIVGA
ncbi:MAG: glycoside hydrolase family 130 protein [Spirochaetota bacterium]